MKSIQKLVLLYKYIYIFLKIEVSRMILRILEQKFQPLSCNKLLKLPSYNIY